MRAFSSLDDLAAAVGETIGPGEPLVVDQDRISAFAQATGDDQWIHCDVERANNGPFGATIAHGYWTIGSIPYFATRLFSLDFARARINYGLNKVRFPAPVLVGSALQATATVVELRRATMGALLTMRYVLEVAGAPKPACVAETVTLLM
jgi:acyl dehydratase